MFLKQLTTKTINILMILNEHLQFQMSYSIKMAIDKCLRAMTSTEYLHEASALFIVVFERLQRKKKKFFSVVSKEL